MDLDVNSRWSKEYAWEWYRQTGWLCGFNYLPSSAQNSTEFWQNDNLDMELIRKELSWAHNLGFNSCRVFLQYIVWKYDKDGFLRRFEEFLDTAYRYGIRVIPVLFDDCTFGDPPLLDPFLGKQREPIPGMLQPSWTPSPGLKHITDLNEYPTLKKYVQDLLNRFGNDERIVIWDLYNEPGFAGIGEKSLPLVKASFSWAHEVGTGQPVTVCIWNEDNTAFNDIVVNNSDIISFHAYTDYDGLKKTIRKLKQYGYPLVCTEWMNRLSGSSIERDLPLFKEENIPCHIWGFVNGRSQAQFPYESKRNDKEPEIWAYDLLRGDGTPYDTRETDAIQRIIYAAGLK